MKKIATLIVFSLSFISFSQLWVQPGATWSYDYNNDNYFCFDFTPFKYRYEGDQQIGGQLCQKFTKINYTINGSSLDSTVTTIGYTYTSGDTVFYWHNNQFFTLFNFGAQVGDSWIISDSIDNAIFTNNVCGDTSRVTVTAIGTMTLDGNTYRTITIKTDTLSPYYLDGVYIERFGKLYNNNTFEQHLFIFPAVDYDNCDQAAIYDFCAISFDCYSDDNFSLNPSGGCGFVLGVEKNKNNSISIYPTLIKNRINIELNDLSPNLTYQITNVLGDVVKASFINTKALEINTSSFSKGIYFITIYNDYQLIKSSKLIKQ